MPAQIEDCSGFTLGLKEALRLSGVGYAALRPRLDIGMAGRPERAHNQDDDLTKQGISALFYYHFIYRYGVIFRVGVPTVRPFDDGAAGAKIGWL